MYEKIKYILYISCQMNETLNKKRHKKASCLILITLTKKSLSPDVWTLNIKKNK